MGHLYQLNNFMMYSSRKGVIFSACPRTFCLYGAYRSENRTFTWRMDELPLFHYFLGDIVSGWIDCISGRTLEGGLAFPDRLRTGILLEISVMVIIYANDRLPEKLMKVFALG